MIQWGPYVFIRITICFCAGILWQIHGHYSFRVLTISTIVVGVAFVALQIVNTKRASYGSIFSAGFFALILFFLFGAIITYQRIEVNLPHHLIRQKERINYYSGVISDFVVEKPNHYNLILRVNQVRLPNNWQPVTGKVMLMLRKAPGQTRPRYGDVLLINGEPNLPEPPLNPNAFDFKAYLTHQQIYHQHYVWPQQVKVIGYAPPSQIMAGSIRFRNYLDSILKKYVTGQRNYAIATALVLGMKEYLDTDIKAAYTRTGTTHVLAVSGLHVALLFWILNAILGKLAKTRRQKLMVFIMLLAIMWLYAFVTALSASVLRAVVMFTLLAGGKFFRRRSNMYNILAATAFGLLVYNPFFLLDVGFQLSFAAVTGIVLWQPRLNSLFEFKNWLPKKLWEGVTASIAAQLATLPLALYYFHQFPVYFLLANLFAITISEFILYVGFLLLAFGWIPGLGQPMGWLMGLLLDGMNSVVLLMQQWPMAIIEGISLSMQQAWILTASILFITWFLLFRNKILLVAASCSIIFYVGLQLVKIQTQHSQKWWVVYNLKNNSGLGFIHGRQALLLSDTAVLTNSNDFKYNLQPHWYQLGIKESQFMSLKNILNQKIPSFITPAGNVSLVWQGLRILVVEKPEQFTTTSSASVLFDYVLLRQNVKIEPVILQQHLRFKTLILDSSNKPWYRKQIVQSCSRQQIPVYDVPKQGAFVYRFNNYAAANGGSK